MSIALYYSEVDIITDCINSARLGDGCKSRIGRRGSAGELIASSAGFVLFRSFQNSVKYAVIAVILTVIATQVYLGRFAHHQNELDDCQKAEYLQRNSRVEVGGAHARRLQSSASPQRNCVYVDLHLSGGHLHTSSPDLWAC